MRASFADVYLACEAQELAEMVRHLGGKVEEEPKKCSEVIRGSVTLVVPGSPHSANFGAGGNPVATAESVSAPYPWHTIHHDVHIFVICPLHRHLVEAMEPFLKGSP